MIRRFLIGVSMVVLAAGTGCGDASRAELEKVKAELAEAKAKLKSLPAEKTPGYLDELERLEALRAKGVLTQEEFETKKKATLGTSPRPEQPLSSMDELSKQLRIVHGLYDKGIITNLEKDQKKGKLIAGPLSLLDLKKDLETVQGLYTDGVVTNLERDALKKQLLEMEPTK